MCRTSRWGWRRYFGVAAAKWAIRGPWRSAYCPWFTEHQLAIALHLRSEPDDVASAHPGIEQQIECQPCLGANRMARLIPRRICLEPCPDAVGIVAGQPRHLACRVFAMTGLWLG